LFSYRHSFHAGNHADVLKHLCQMLLIDKLKIKNKGFVYIDTHSGAGLYDLESDNAKKTNEFRQGIELLMKYQGNNPILNSMWSLFLTIIAIVIIQAHLKSPVLYYVRKTN